MALTKVNTDLLEDGGKLDGIEAGADVTDTANVTAAGALMDSELTSEASVKALNQGVATGDSPTFAAVTANGGVVVDNFTLDGTTLALSSGDMTLDAAGRIDLSADDSGEIRFFDGSSMYGQIKDDDDRLKIQGLISNKAMLLVGNDGGSEVTMLSLDAENAGAATFNSTIAATGIDVTGTATMGGIEVSDTDDIRIRLLNGTTFKAGIQVVTTAGDMIAGSAVDDLAIRAQTNMLFATGGNAERMRIDSSGNVGIGTNTPSSYFSPQLVVHSSSNLGGITIRSNATTDTNYLLFADGTSGNERYRGYVSYDHNADTMKLATGASPAITIDSSQNVGIGTSSPSRQLEIYDDGTNGQAVLALTAQNTENSRIMFADPDDNNIGILDYSHADDSMRFTVNNSERMRIDSSGNLLVGTSQNNPTSSGVNVAGQEFSTTGGVRSTVASNAAATFNRKTDDGGIVLFRKDGTTVGSIGVTGTNDIEIHSTATNHTGLRLGEGYYIPTNNDGAAADNAVDIGLASIRYKDLYLSGGVISKLSVTSETEIASYNNNNATGAKYKISFKQNGTQVGVIEVGTSSTAYITSSDYRLKENVVAITGATERLKQLNPSRFNFIVDADTTVDGFLAHEVQDVVPEAIAGSKDAMKDEEYEVTPAVLDDDGNVVTEAVMGTRSVPDYQGIDQSKLVPLLVATIQELEARITQLENN